MHLATFNAVCNVELGDKVGFASTTTEIIDIRTVHYLKDQRVEFEFSLAIAPWRWYKRQDFVYPVVEQLSQERWEKAITHARECFKFYRTAPAGILAANLIASDIFKYKRGDRNPELLEDLEGIKL